MLKKPATPLQFNRILLTGAAGNLGQVLRPRLKKQIKNISRGLFLLVF